MKLSVSFQGSQDLKFQEEVNTQGFSSIWLKMTMVLLLRIPDIT